MMPFYDEFPAYETGDLENRPKWPLYPFKFSISCAFHLPGILFRTKIVPNTGEQHAQIELFRVSQKKSGKSGKKQKKKKIGGFWGGGNGFALGVKKSDIFQKLTL